MALLKNYSTNYDYSSKPKRSNSNIRIGSNYGGLPEVDSTIDALGGLVKAGGKQLSAKNKKRIAKFSKDFKRLKKMSGADPNDLKSDSITRAMYQSFLRMCLDLVSEAQEKYIETRGEHAMYSLLALINQSKDLSESLRNFDDLEAQAEHIGMKILLPSFIHATNNLLSSILPIKGVIDSMDIDPENKVKLKGQLDQLLKDHAIFLQEQGTAVKAQATTYLIGE